MVSISTPRFDHLEMKCQAAEDERFEIQQVGVILGYSRRQVNREEPPPFREL